MSIDRELLKEALYVIGEYTEDAQERTEILIAHIKKVLAQPEQTEQEPVAWMVETHFNNEPIKEIHTVKPMERVYKYCKVTELYATPQKRARLSDEEVRGKYRDIALDNPLYVPSYYAGFRDAERTHGIGVDDE